MFGIDFFSGRGSISSVAEKHGIEMISLDINPQFQADLIMDINDFSPGDYNLSPDFLWFSPDCTSFSIASSGFHRSSKNGYLPKTQKAIDGDKMMLKVIEIIKYYENKNGAIIWFIENPRGMLQKMDYMQPFEKYKQLITYCQYGDFRMKPTNIWTNSSWHGKPICKNGDKCHEASPRCSHTGGTVGLKNKEERSIIPKILCEDIINFIKSNQ